MNQYIEHTLLKQEATKAEIKNFLMKQLNISFWEFV